MRKRCLKYWVLLNLVIIDKVLDLWLLIIKQFALWHIIAIISILGKWIDRWNFLRFSWSNLLGFKTFSLFFVSMKPKKFDRKQISFCIEFQLMTEISIPEATQTFTNRFSFSFYFFLSSSLQMSVGEFILWGEL